MPAARAALAEASAADVEVPPDATTFRAGGVDYYLYMGATEMRTLQREWGTLPSPADSPDEFKRKQELYHARLDNSGIVEDDLTVIRIGLTRYRQAAANGKPTRPITNEDVLRILEDLEPDEADRGKSPFLLIGRLRVRFLLDMFGVKKAATDVEGAPDPNVPRGEAPSTRSTS